MKDARGDVYSYTTLAGFKIQKEIPAEVVFDAPANEEIDINSTLDNAEGQSTPYRHYPTWPYWLVIILLCGVVAYLVLCKNQPSFKTTESKAALETRGNVAKKPEIREESQIIPNPDFVARVEELVAANFTDPGYSVETLADAMGITRVHLNRKLKEAGAPAPKMILKKARMEKALTMLREGLSVSDVYAACGFSSASYFSSAFKEYFGYTPSDVTKPNV